MKDKGHPQVCNVFSYYKTFAPAEKVKEAQEWCKNALRGCTECKKIMADILIDYLEPIRERRRHLEENKKERIIEPWMVCLEKIQLETGKTMKEVKKALHILARDNEI